MNAKKSTVLLSNELHYQHFSTTSAVLKLPLIYNSDYAGWTPLHEACNHGSTVCVREILQRCPEVDLLSQVDGVTPLHDALSNGHVEIGKLLLQHGGECIYAKLVQGNYPESIQSLWCFY